MKTPGLQPKEPKPRKKWNYIGAPAVFALEQACQALYDAFCIDCRYGGIYGVGSAFERSNFRDVDVRLMLDDDAFRTLFPAVEFSTTGPCTWEFDPRWLLMTTAISQWLSKQSGLPVDFQFQPMSHANHFHGGGRRHPIGMRHARKRPQ